MTTSICHQYELDGELALAFEQRDPSASGTITTSSGTWSGRCGKQRLLAVCRSTTGIHSIFWLTLKTIGLWITIPAAFHDSDEIGPKMLARIAKRSGLQPEDL